MVIRNSWEPCTRMEVMSFPLQRALRKPLKPCTRLQKVIPQDPAVVTFGTRVRRFHCSWFPWRVEVLSFPGVRAEMAKNRWLQTTSERPSHRGCGKGKKPLPTEHFGATQSSRVRKGQEIIAYRLLQSDPVIMSAERVRNRCLQTTSERPSHQSSRVRKV